MSRLTTVDHDRGAGGFTYVYPVLSRRARGLSVGINLNPNNACNWRCAYCQVPNLVRGKAPAIDLEQLRGELHAQLTDVVQGDFLERRAPPELRRLNDIAFSGNGEPTTSRQLGDALALVGEALDAFDLRGRIEVVLITNGSLVGQPHVDAALATLAGMNGVAWFKLDSATREGLRATNDVPMQPADHLDRLRRCATICPTWIQTCVVARDGHPPSEVEQTAYIDAVGALYAEGLPLNGVLLYGLARVSHQPEAATLSALPAKWLEDYAERIRATGLTVRVHA